MATGVAAGIAAITQQAAAVMRKKFVVMVGLQLIRSGSDLQFVQQAFQLVVRQSNTIRVAVDSFSYSAGCIGNAFATGRGLLVLNNDQRLEAILQSNDAFFQAIEMAAEFFERARDIENSDGNCTSILRLVHVNLQKGQRLVPRVRAATGKLL